MKQYIAVAKDNLKYPEYRNLNWIKGERYAVKEESHTLTVESETGNFYFSPEMKEKLREVFDFEEDEVEGDGNDA